MSQDKLALILMHWIVQVNNSVDVVIVKKEKHIGAHISIILHNLFI